MIIRINVQLLRCCPLSDYIFLLFPITASFLKSARNAVFYFNISDLVLSTDKKGYRYVLMKKDITRR